MPAAEAEDRTGPGQVQFVPVFPERCPGHSGEPGVSSFHSSRRAADAGSLCDTIESAARSARYGPGPSHPPVSRSAWL